jgi:DNA-binding NarL/FixJ family response regulator
MEAKQRRELPDSPISLRKPPDSSTIRQALIVSELRFLRDSLAEILDRGPALRVCGRAASLIDALALAQKLRPQILLLDVAIPGGTKAALQLSGANPGVHLIALGVCETEESVLAWAEAGIAGYVPNTASVDDLVLLIEQISRGEQTCSSRVAGSLIRHIAASSRTLPHGTAAPSTLTSRELEILHLVGKGLSNKDIARRLEISLGTTKTHVHNLLGKLSLQRRVDVITRVHHLQESPEPNSQ